MSETLIEHIAKILLQIDAAERKAKGIGWRAYGALLVAELNKLLTENYNLQMDNYQIHQENQQIYTRMNQILCERQKASNDSPPY